MCNAKNEDQSQPTDYAGLKFEKIRYRILDAVSLIPYCSHSHVFVSSGDDEFNIPSQHKPHGV